ncbi:DUF3168 domain-containing protein [Effusibacillus dendaii]|uniref:DUF3168 domain-containing protein n=1 Tax=Effusibacillus dendaii TaxID=2743772 RepID=A0A7I8D8H4_9BACL|nr:DUF3168 domain-containing protein [Effusibacillus dendaii]BCJ86453.1 hypothetical protein skT53_14380 [Effusibacillus dendaii]
MKSALGILQTAIYSRLKSSSTLTSKAPIFDAVPENQPFPYVTLGDETASDWMLPALQTGQEVVTDVHIWSRYPGYKETKDLMSLVIQTLTEPPLTLDGGFHISYARVDFQETFRDPDGITRHGVVRFRFKIA